MAYIGSSEKELNDTLRKQVSELDSKDPGVVARAAATISVLGTKTEAGPLLPGAVPKLLSLLPSDDQHVKKNSVAALSTIIGFSDESRNRVLSSNGLLPSLFACLAWEKADPGLQINVASALTLVAQDAKGAQQLVESDGLSVLTKLLRDTKEANVAEAVADVYCTLGGHPALRSLLVDEGLVEALVTRLEAQPPSTEVQVRALLCLGMLVGSVKEGMARFVEAPGGIAAVVGLIRSSDDDVKSISADIFGKMAADPQLRPLLEPALRARSDVD